MDYYGMVSRRADVISPRWPEALRLIKRDTKRDTSGGAGADAEVNGSAPNGTTTPMLPVRVPM